MGKVDIKNTPETRKIARHLLTATNFFVEYYFNVFLRPGLAEHVNYIEEYVKLMQIHVVDDLNNEIRNFDEFKGKLGDDFVITNSILTGITPRPFIVASNKFHNLKNPSSPFPFLKFLVNETGLEPNELLTIAEYIMKKLVVEGPRVLKIFIEDFIKKQKEIDESNDNGSEKKKEQSTNDDVGEVTNTKETKEEKTKGVEDANG